MSNNNYPDDWKTWDTSDPRSPTYDGPDDDEDYEEDDPSDDGDYAYDNWKDERNDERL